MKLSVINIDALAPWVESIKYNQHTARWVVRFFPGKIIESLTFEKIIHELVAHAAREIIYLVADSLGVTVEQVTTGGRTSQKITDARQVAAIVLVRKMPRVSYRAIARQLGWSNHSMVHYALNNEDVREIQQKVNRVYSRYPFLNKIETTIKDS